MSDDAATLIRETEQRMAMARPWDNAEHETLWEITGVYPGDRGTFTRCLAITLPFHVTGSETPLFVYVGALADSANPISPTWITHAIPLMIVHRDNPDTAYWAADQEWVERR